MGIKRILREEINRYIKNDLSSLVDKSLNESVRRFILNESQESKSQSKAIKLAMQNGMDRDRAERFVRIELRNDLSELRHTDTAKFTLGCARLYFERQFDNADKVSLLNEILGLIAKKYYNDFDQNLNGLNMNELSDKFSKELYDIELQNRSELNGKQYERNDYDIVMIKSFDEAEKYRKYVYENNPWCITYRKDMWDSYTNDGYNQVYFCLKNGFEYMEAPEETGNPKDEYGLSMISVIVDDDGKLKYSTTRWNHANKANGDHDLTVKEISSIIGINFYEAFKPNDKLHDILVRFKNGEDPHNLFTYLSEYGDGIYKVLLKGKYNLIDSDNKLISDEWYDSIDNSNDGLMKVLKNERFNFINIKGELISPRWFDYADDFYHGFAIVELEGKSNFIDVNGNILSKQWFDDVHIFQEGYARVIIQKEDSLKYNFIDKNGDIKSDIWFDYAGIFKDGLSKIKKDNKYNIIDNDFNLLLGQWFDMIDHFYRGLCKVKLNNKFNYIRLNGRLISEQWFDYLGVFTEGFAMAELDDKYNFIDINGKILSDIWFDRASDFYDGTAVVLYGRKEYDLDKQGKLH